MNIKKYYPSNIIRTLKKGYELQRKMMLHIYFVAHPFERDMYYSILKHFNGDEIKTAEYIKEHGLIDPRYRELSTIYYEDQKNNKI